MTFLECLKSALLNFFNLGTLLGLSIGATVYLVFWAVSLLIQRNADLFFAGWLSGRLVFRARKYEEPPRPLDVGMALEKGAYRLGLYPTVSVSSFRSGRRAAGVGY